MKVLFLVGYSGSGKSDVANFFKEANYKTLNVSELVQKSLSNEIPNFLRLPEKEKLAKAKEFLKKHQDYVGKLIYNKIKSLKGKIVVDGIKSPSDVKLFSDYKILAVTCSLKTRIDRRNKRDSKDRANAIKERDKFDKKRGMDELIKMADIKLDNSGSFADLKNSFEEIKKFVF